MDIMSYPQTMTPNKDRGSCSCGWDDCLGLCSFLEPLDDDVLTRAPRGGSTSMDSFNFDTLPFHFPPKETAPSDDYCSVNVEKVEDTVASVEVENQKTNCGDNQEEFAAQTSTNPAAKAPEPRLQEPASETKRMKEKKRREALNKGFQEMARIIFAVDPSIKERAKLNGSGSGMLSCADESRLLGRVELVNSAVMTMARLHKDNEIHKMLIAQLTTSGTTQEPLDMPSLSLPNVIVSSLSFDEEDTTENDKVKKENTYALSRSEIKRNREKKRRKNINTGLDKLSQMILVIDPELKATAEERAQRIQPNGSTSKTKEKQVSQVMCHVELVNSVVATLARLHKDNEIHKATIAQLARARGGASEPSGSLPPNVVSSNISIGDIKSLPYTNLLANDAAAGTNPQDDAAMDSSQDTFSDSSVTVEPYSLREILLDIPIYEDGPATKRLKTT